MSGNTKKRKSYYVQAAKGKKARKNYQLAEGMKGFLVTCNKYEKETVREAYNIFNEYADELYGKEQVGQSADIDEDDIEAMVQQEVSALQTTMERRFQSVDTGANNVLFFKTTLDNPHQLLHHIFSDLHEKRINKSRHMLRLSPVLATCRPDLAKLESLCEKLLVDFFTVDSPKSFSILFKARNNNTVSRQDVYDVIGRVLADISPLSRVDLDNPQLVINVDVVQTVCCVGVVKDFYKFRKYNIQEVVKVGEDQEKKDVSGGDKSEKCEEKPDKPEINNCEETTDTVEEKLEKVEEKPVECDEKQENTEECVG